MLDPDPYPDPHWFNADPKPCFFFLLPIWSFSFLPPVLSILNNQSQAHVRSEYFVIIYLHKVYYCWAAFDNLYFIPQNCWKLKHSQTTLQIVTLSFIVSLFRGNFRRICYFNFPLQEINRSECLTFTWHINGSRSASLKRSWSDLEHLKLIFFDEVFAQKKSYFNFIIKFRLLASRSARSALDWLSAHRGPQDSLRHSWWSFPRLLHRHEAGKQSLNHTQYIFFVP